MAQLSRRRWLEEGLALLEEAGAEALTIESLTTRLGVTKGSFYHHFTNYQDFKQRLLSFWEEEGTLRIIQWAEQEASPPEKLARVLRASLHPSRLDVALRAWALQDEQVRVHQQRIDQQRLAYLEAVVLPSGLITCSQSFLPDFSTVFTWAASTSSHPLRARIWALCTSSSNSGWQRRTSNVCHDLYPGSSVADRENGG